MKSFPNAPDVNKVRRFPVQMVQQLITSLAFVT